MFSVILALIFAFYSLLLLHSINGGISKELRQSMGPQDLEILQVELEHRKYWAFLLLLMSFLIMLPKLLLW